MITIYHGRIYGLIRTQRCLNVSIQRQITLGRRCMNVKTTLDARTGGGVSRLARLVRFQCKSPSSHNTGEKRDAMVFCRYFLSNPRLRVFERFPK